MTWRNVVAHETHRAPSCNVEANVHRWIAELGRCACGFDRVDLDVTTHTAGVLE